MLGYNVIVMLMAFYMLGGIKRFVYIMGFYKLVFC